jgi:tetratricopeptide (TPR) repeat protein
MKASEQITIAASVLLMVCLLGSVVCLRQVDRARPSAALQEVLYIRSPQLIKRLSLGYDGLLADVYWTRAVQYFGGRREAHARHLDLLAPLLEITTTLDPHLVVAYEFGANFLSPQPPNGAGRPDQAVPLVEFGIQNNPDDWKLYYELGFIYYMDKKDYAKAAEAFERGSKVARAQPVMKVLAAQMAQHAGDTQMARTLWMTTYETTHDKDIRENAVAHLYALQVDDDVTELERLVAQYQRATGKIPETMEEMVQAGWLREIVRDPTTKRPYKIMADGRVEVEDPDRIPFIGKGVPPGYKPSPPKEWEHPAN